MSFGDADEDVGVLASAGVGEGEDVFDDLAFLLVGCGGEGVLGLFEVERGALVLREEGLDRGGEGCHVTRRNDTEGLLGNWSLGRRDGVAAEPLGEVMVVER